MNMIPRAKKFRIRRASPLTVDQRADADRADVAQAGATGSDPLLPRIAPERKAASGQAAPPKPAAASTQPVLAAPPVKAAAKPEPMLFEPTQDDGFGDLRFSNAARPNPAEAKPGDTKSASLRTAPETRSTILNPQMLHAGIALPQDLATEDEEDAIRRESLTGRQLRMARRMAQKHNLPATSDFDAVRLLRRAGIDPFQRSNLLELTVPDAPTKSTAMQIIDPAGLNTLPQTVRQAPPPSKDLRKEPARVQDIMDIQRDLAKRRRRKSLMLMIRLAFFVGLPTLLSAIYFYTIATPLYATKSEFVIQKADAPGGGSMGGLLTGTAFATATDSITVQSYLQSRDAMLRLDTDLGYKSHFSGEKVDPLQRLEPNATNEAAYRLYKRNVKIGFDPTEGIIRMEVVALDPAVSAAFSEALIRYAEQQVDQLTQRVREDQMKGARESYQEAEANMLAAQRKVVDLQEKFKVLSSEVEVSMIASQITALEAQLTQERLKLEELLANSQPSKARVDPVRNRIANLEKEVAGARAKMTERDAGGTSLAEIQSELLAAQADVQTRQLMLSTALASMETARTEANRQVRYLSVGVSPIPPDEPTYPRAFEDSFMAFMIFGGIYLMLSMTASILREQVSA